MKYRKTELIKRIEGAYESRRKQYAEAEQRRVERFRGAYLDWVQTSRQQLVASLSMLAGQAENGTVTRDDLRKLVELGWAGGTTPEPVREHRERNTEQLLDFLRGTVVVEDDLISASSLERAGFGSLRQYIYGS